MQEEQVGCHLAVAARNAVGTVSHCAGCGCVHLTMAHMTLRLDPDAFGELSDLVTMAQRRLGGRSAASASIIASARDLTH